MSFFQKLKQNIGIEEPAEVLKEAVKETPKKEKKEDRLFLKKEFAGQLSVDVYETEENLVIQSTIAGVKAKDVNVSVENGVVKISGNRQKPEEDEDKERKYFYQECYWGPFLRQLTLPEEIDESKIEAKMKDGVLTIKLPKIRKKAKRKIVIEEEV